MQIKNYSSTQNGFISVILVFVNIFRSIKTIFKISLSFFEMKTKVNYRELNL